MPGEKGMYAAETIQTGDIIVSEHPILVSPTYMCLSGLSMTKAAMYKMLFERLPDHQKKSAKAMKNSKGSVASAKEEGIIRTNGIAVELVEDQHGEGVYSAVFENIGRCNHRFVRSQSIACTT
jgi:hypothetical protein